MRVIARSGPLKAPCEEWALEGACEERALEEQALERALEERALKKIWVLRTPGVVPYAVALGLEPTGLTAERPVV